MVRIAYFITITLLQKRRVLSFYCVRLMSIKAINVKLQYSIHANLLEFEPLLTLSVYNLLSSVTHRWNRLHYYNIYIVFDVMPYCHLSPLWW